jgi:phosphoglycerate kinase
MGVFEIPQFARGTLEVAKAVAAASDAGATSIVGGGDSVAAVHQSGVADRISHISTGGGASLEFLAGEKLPGVEALTSK